MEGGFGLDFMGWGRGRKSGDDDTLIHIWIYEYALQCAVHVALVWMEFCRRNTRMTARGRSRLVDEDAHISENEDEDDKVSAALGEVFFVEFWISILKFLGSIWILN
jgi:hypothetical protein